jgi:hypothetical protein
MCISRSYWKQLQLSPTNKYLVQKVVTDLFLGYKASDAITFTVGANNIRCLPDKADAAFENRSDGRLLTGQEEHLNLE